MSWEDCGFKPGRIEGPAVCPKGACDGCDGAHHFYASFDEAGEEEFFECKHCGARADMVDVEMVDEDH